MADVTITYKSASIATMDASGTKTLETAGKYCEDDITVAYVKPSGGEVFYSAKGAAYVKNLVSPAASQDAGYSGCEYLETVFCPNATSASQNAFYNSLNLKSVEFPLLTVPPNYLIRQQGPEYNKLETLTLGSIGHPVTSLPNRWRYGAYAANLVVTLYVEAAALADVPSAVSSYANGDSTYMPSGSTPTIVYRNSTTGEVITG